MGTRTRAQLSSYFLRIKRQKKVGPWNLDEIERFNKSIKTNFPNINEIIKSDDVHLASTIWPRLAIDVGTRTPSQCRYRWFVVSDPSIVKYKSFTEDEDRIILSMNKKVPSLPEIALSLPHRSYSQVKTRINSLSAKRRKKWSEQEIELLLKGIELYGLSEWKKVSEYVDTRNQSQCQHKYIVNRYSIDYYFKKFRNVTKEDSDLINKLEKYFPQQPLTISLLVPGYTLNQIKYTLLTHKLKNKTQLYALNRRWTPDEYSTLYDMFLAYGADWEKIASCLPDDITPIHCKYKLQVTTSSRKCIKPHIMLVREALRLKYNEEKENGKFMPKERVYYRG
ncbi:hypothetical protein K502DRAFT_292536 [Neoconidiobolus thromboides FSU 785]|nr:hypothetical protein K502DRAFT_292536 [Neoconidiobolus thromboides FSU 785]